VLEKRMDCPHIPFWEGLRMMVAAGTPCQWL